MVNTPTKYDLTAISAKSENLGIVQRRNINGDNTAAREIKIRRATYIKRRIIAKIRKITRNTRVIRESVCPLARFGIVIAFTIHA